MAAGVQNCGIHRIGDDRKGNELFLDTKGVCFLCLSESSPFDACDNITTKESFQSICHYLNIHPLAVLSNSARGRTLNKSEKENALLCQKGAFSVLLCSNCSPIVKKLTQMIRQVEVKKMLIDYQLKLLNETLLTSQENPAVQYLWERLQEKMISNSRDVEARLVENLRHETRKKCAAQVNFARTTSLPRVTLKRIQTATIEQSHVSKRFHSPDVKASDESKEGGLGVSTETITIPTVPNDLLNSSHLTSSGPDLSSKFKSVNGGPNISQVYKSLCERIPFGENSTEFQYQCTLCKNMCSAKSTFRHHLIFTHPEKFFADKRLPLLPEKLFKQQCKYLFLSEIKLAVSPQATFSGNRENILKCTFCSLLLQDVEHFRQHLLVEHYHAMEGKLIRLQEMVLQSKLSKKIIPPGKRTNFTTCRGVARNSLSKTAFNVKTGKRNSPNKEISGFSQNAQRIENQADIEKDATLPTTNNKPEISPLISNPIPLNTSNVDQFENETNAQTKTMVLQHSTKRDNVKGITSSNINGETFGSVNNMEPESLQNLEYLEESGRQEFFQNDKINATSNTAEEKNSTCFAFVEPITGTGSSFSRNFQYGNVRDQNFTTPLNIQEPMLGTELYVNRNNNNRVVSNFYSQPSSSSASSSNHIPLKPITTITSSPSPTKIMVQQNKTKRVRKSTNGLATYHHQLVKKIYNSYSERVASSSKTQRSKCLVCKNVYVNTKIRLHITAAHPELFFAHVKPKIINESKEANTHFRDCCEAVVLSEISRANQLKRDMGQSNYIIKNKTRRIMCAYCNVEYCDVHHLKFHMFQYHYNVLEEKLMAYCQNGEMGKEGKASDKILNDVQSRIRTELDQNREPDNEQSFRFASNTAEKIVYSNTNGKTFGSLMELESSQNLEHKSIDEESGGGRGFVQKAGGYTTSSTVEAKNPTCLEVVDVLVTTSTSDGGDFCYGNVNEKSFTVTAPSGDNTKESLLNFQGAMLGTGSHMSNNKAIHNISSHPLSFTATSSNHLLMPAITTATESSNHVNHTQQYCPMAALTALENSQYFIPPAAASVREQQVGTYQGTICDKQAYSQSVQVQPFSASNIINENKLLPTPNLQWNSMVMDHCGSEYFDFNASSNQPSNSFSTYANSGNMLPFTIKMETFDPNF